MSPLPLAKGRDDAAPHAGGSNGSAKEVNNRGQVAGNAENTTPDPTCEAPQVLQVKPVVWEEGQIHELSTLPGDSAGVALAINDNGQAVGATGDCANLVHAVLWQNGVVTDLGNLGGTMDNFPQDINNQGQVVGFSNLPGDTTGHAFLWSEKEGMQDLGTLPGDFSSVGNGINSRGQVAGTSVDAGGNPRAVLWQRGVMTDLNTLVPAGSNMFLLDAYGINSRGEIVGDALTVNTNEVHAFLATPCNPRRNTKEGCEDVAEGTSAAGGATSERSNITLPENVRTLLQQQAACRYHLPGESVSFEADGSLHGTVLADGANGNGVISNLAGGPLVTLNPTSLNFGYLGVGGKSSPRTTTLTNTGSATLHITRITITGKDMGDFSQMNNCPASLGAGNFCVIAVTFRPGAYGPRIAQVSISDDAPSPQQVPLSGNGTICGGTCRKGGCGAGCRCIPTSTRGICAPSNDQLADNETRKDQQCSAAPVFPLLDRDLEWATK